MKTISQPVLSEKRRKEERKGEEIKEEWREKRKEKGERREKREERRIRMAWWKRRLRCMILRMPS
jgi:hypothetical protein